MNPWVERTLPWSWLRRVADPPAKLAFVWLILYPILMLATTGRLPLHDEEPITPRPASEEGLFSPNVYVFLSCCGLSAALTCYEMWNWVDNSLALRPRRHEFAARLGRMRARGAGGALRAEELQQGLRLKICVSSRERQGRSHSIDVFCVMEEQPLDHFTLVFQQQSGGIIARLTLRDLDLVHLGRNMLLMAPVLPAGMVPSAVVESATVLAFADQIHFDLFVDMLRAGGVTPVTLQGASAQRLARHLAQQDAELERREREREEERERERHAELERREREREEERERERQAELERRERERERERERGRERGRERHAELGDRRERERDRERDRNRERGRIPTSSSCPVFSGRGGNAADVDHEASVAAGASAQAARADARKISATASSVLRSPAANSTRAASVRPQLSSSPAAVEAGRSASEPLQRQATTRHRADSSPQHRPHPPPPPQHTLPVAENPLAGEAMYGELDWWHLASQESGCNSWRAMQERHAELERGRQLRELIR